MDNQQILYKLNNTEKDITQFLIALGQENDEDEIKKQIQQLDLQNRIEDMNNWDYRAVQIVPLLLKIIMNKRMRIFFDILKAIIVLLGNLKPDGFISEYAFSDIVKDTPFSKEEIFEELKKKGYIENHTLSPNFKPMDKHFHFDMNARFSDLKDDILEIILAIPKDTSTANALITLLKDQSLVSLYPDIIRSLTKIGHPVAIPVLLELQGNQKTARKALIEMSLRDIKELKQLLEQGVTKDVWGNDLREKVSVSIREILPLLLEALRSDEYSLKDKRLICFLFHEMGVNRLSDIELFVHVLPLLYEEQVENCYVTKVLLSCGKKTVPLVCNFIEKNSIAKNPGEKESCKTGVVKRFLYILGETGTDAVDAVPLLNKLRDENEPLTKFIQDVLLKIQPVSQEKPVTEDETSLSIDKVQKQNIDVDPGEYVLF